MIPYTRRKTILELLHTKDIITIDEIVSDLNVSVATARRDLKTLEAEDSIEILSGGAAKLVVNIAEKSLQEKINQNKTEKEIIGRYASTYVNEGQFIYLGPGTTENHMIKYLQGKDVTVVTNGAFHISELTKYKIKTILLGGDLLTEVAVVVGSMALLQLSSMYFDKCFIGATGITPDGGMTTSNINVANINKAAIKNSREVYYLGDHSKFGLKSRFSFAQWDDDYLIITTNKTDSAYYNVKKTIVVE